MPTAPPRTLAIGDIHGCFRALSTLVAKIPIAPGDCVVGLGDYIDRGPNSREVLDWLIERSASGALVALKGNHEIMLMEAATSPAAHYDWRLSGGAATLKSYDPAGREGRLDDIPPAHWDFIRNTCRDYHETPTHFFVHANAFGDLPLGDQPEHMLFWEKFHRRPPPHVSGRIMICGHTPQPDGRPLSIGHAVCIDTGACKGGWLTALDVATGEYWQANEACEFRSARLDGIGISRSPLPRTEPRP